MVYLSWLDHDGARKFYPVICEETTLSDCGGCMKSPLEDSGGLGKSTLYDDGDLGNCTLGVCGHLGNSTLIDCGTHKVTLRGGGSGVPGKSPLGGVAVVSQETLPW